VSLRDGSKNAGGRLPPLRLVVCISTYIVGADAHIRPLPSILQTLLKNAQNLPIIK